MKLSDFNIEHVDLSYAERTIAKKLNAFIMRLSGNWVADVFLSTDGIYYFTVDGRKYYPGGDSERSLILNIVTVVKIKKTTYEVLDKELNLLYS